MGEGGNDTTRKAGSAAAASRGRQAEALAADYLERQGLTVVERNFRVRGGEIDLVCRDGRTLVFTEVRLRSHGGFGGAAASITAAKRRRIVLAARCYLARLPAGNRLACRFDCLLLDRLEPEAIEWLRGAFGADDWL